MKRLLIVVDYQNDFVDGALGFEGAELLDERIAAKIDEYRDTGDYVSFTFDTHHKDYLETFEGTNLPIPHCIEGTPGHELYGQVATKLHESDDVFLKPTFGSTALFERLLKRQSVAAAIGALPFASIELVGLVSNMCVLSNAVIARTACPDVPIIIDAECTAAPDSDMNEKALDIMEGLQIRVINRKPAAEDEQTELGEPDDIDEDGEVAEVDDVDEAGDIDDAGNADDVDEAGVEAE